MNKDKELEEVVDGGVAPEDLDDELGNEAPDELDVEDGELVLDESLSYDDEDDDEDTSPKARSAKSEDDEDDETEVEADLEAILRDRMATADEEDDEDDEDDRTVQVERKTSGSLPGDVIICGSCFLGVNRSQLDNQLLCPHCGDELTAV